MMQIMANYYFTLSNNESQLNMITFL
jgi:hypothetical protein